MSRFVLRSVPFATRLRATLGARELLERDRKRAAKLLAGLSPHGPVKNFKQRALASTIGSDSIDVTDTGVTYTASVGVGNPATQYTLLIDTGGSNTWVGAGTSYNPTSTSQDSGNVVNQSIGVASSAQGFNDVDGILGVGPVDLTQGTVSNTTEVPTVTDNLYNQGLISTESLGIFYEPSSTTDVANGELNFGGPDSTKYTGELNYVPITSTAPASNYWGIDQSVTYGNGTTLLNTTAGIVDTGTTLLLLATDAFQAYQQATGAALDQTTGLLTISETQYNQLQSIYFNIGGVTYELTPNAQIWPRALNTVLGGQQNRIYLITSDLGSPSGSGLDFINGFGWLQRFYSVFDTTNGQVGIATTPYTDAETD
ncbi:acid protease [Boletus reticuloceps]|uniref:Acid protease n=1 Tax=Boletus reticuloceps TaxID=495285 RepID=A0A8I2YPP7_9AGAM|nr:acid protease [Boletus reticuloceps]